MHKKEETEEKEEIEREILGEHERTERGKRQEERYESDRNLVTKWNEERKRGKSVEE